MRKTIWTIIVLIMVLIMSGTYAFSTSLGGWANLANTSSKTVLDGENTTSSSTFSRNFNLSLKRDITPIVSYNLNLRTSLIDSESANYLTGATTLSYKRSLEPTLALSVKNNIYDMTTGYRRQEQWSTAHYSRSGRLASEFSYARFSLQPRQLPSISLNLERQRHFDYLPVAETLSSTNSYSVDSSYALPSNDIKFGYNISFSRDVNRTPLSTLEKSVKANFSNNYNIGYSDYLWNRKLNYSTMYRGNYTRNRNRQYHTTTGDELSIRKNIGGFFLLNSDEQLPLGPEDAELTDGSQTPTSINLTTQNNQIGIQIPFGQSVDRLYIYVDNDVSTEGNLIGLGKWQVYKSSDNSLNSWTEVTIGSVLPPVYDSINEKYRYEILFSSSHEKFYFKVINRVVSSVSGVMVTEIQALGTDTITSIGADTTVSKSFSQGINLNVGIRPVKDWDFALSYSIDRADQTPISVMDSANGILENILSKSLNNENENIITTVTRNYGSSARWQTHSLLTSRMNINRNEGFNNTGGAQSASNSYSLGMNYVPLPTLDTNMTILRSDSFTDNEKVSINDSLLLSADTKLHRDLNMVTDIGFSNSKSLANDTTTSLSSINGSLDARITRKTTGTLNYGYSTTTTGDDSSFTKDFSTSLNYQAGRFINFSGGFNYAKSTGNVDMSESVGVDWLPLPKIRLNANYRHSDSESDTSKTKTDSASGYGTIYITKFANIRVSYSYSQTDNETSITKSHNLNTNLNCRF